MVYQDEYRAYVAVLRQRWPAARFNMYIPSQKQAPFTQAINGTWLDIVQDLQQRECQGDAGSARVLATGADTSELLATSGATVSDAQEALMQGPVGHYADPRSYLNQNNVLAFQQLVPDPDYENLDGVRSIIRGTFMDPSVGGKASTPDLLLRAAQDANMSAYFLASWAVYSATNPRDVKQPSALSSGLACPSNSRLTCYNPLALTAWRTPAAAPNQTACQDSAVQRAALVFAEQQGWFTFEQGLQDGADVLAERLTVGVERGDVTDSATLYQVTMARWGNTMLLGGGDTISVLLQSQDIYRAYMLQSASQRANQRVTFNLPLLFGLPRLLPSAQGV